MRRMLFAVGVVVLFAPTVLGQGITGFTGGSEFGAYYGGTTGDVVGFRFTVAGGSPIEIDQLGVWNADTNAGGAGLTSAHQVGIWDASQALLASATVDPSTGTVIGDWTYASIPPLTLNPGETYTAGVLYTETDGDSYISSASSASTAPEVTWVQSVYPAAASLGFVYPANNSTSFGRFGPNFTFAVVPVELQSFSVE